MTKHIYLDVCVLSRPFDDQNQARIHLETGALQIVLAHIRTGDSCYAPGAPPSLAAAGRDAGVPKGSCVT